jgi:hypothetical protein
MSTNLLGFTPFSGAALFPSPVYLHPDAIRKIVLLVNSHTLNAHWSQPYILLPYPLCFAVRKSGLPRCLSPSGGRLATGTYSGAWLGCCGIMVHLFGDHIHIGA